MTLYPGIRYMAYAGVSNKIGESAGCFMPADSPEDGWRKIVDHYRQCEERRHGWTGGMEAVYLEPVYHWRVEKR